MNVVTFPGIAALILRRPILRRSLFVVGHAAVLALVVWAGILPLIDVFASRDAEIARDESRLARYRAVVRQENAVLALSQARDGIGDGRGVYQAGGDVGVVEAGLQARMKQITEMSRARLQAVRALPERLVDGNAFVGVRIEITAPLDALHKALTSIETQRPDLFITSAVIRAAGSGQALGFQVPPRTGAPGAATPGAEDALEAVLDVYGAWQRGPSNG